MNTALKSSPVIRSTMTEDDLVKFSEAGAWRKGRSVRDGYARGWGLQFSDLRPKVAADPLYQAGMRLAHGRTVVSDDNRMNLYLIMRFFLARIPFGHIIEFGSFKGGNAIFMAYVASQLNPGVQVYSLDTFSGMPETDKSIDAHSKGDFAGVDLEELRRFTSASGLTNLHFVEGMFQDTAEDVLRTAAPIALAHVDCDIFDAVRYSYEVVRPHMVEGGYLVFDDAVVSSCIGATEVIEDLLVRRDGLNSEQIYPHFVFRAPPR